MTRPMDSRCWRVAVLAAAMGVSCTTAAAGGPCLADLDGNGAVDWMDLITLLNSWGVCPGCPADFNGDDQVGSLDLAFLAESWGPCPQAPVPGDTELFTETVAVDATDQDSAAEHLLVTHLYATGPAVTVGNALRLVGSADITTDNATIFQHPAGDDLPPLSVLFPSFPTLRHDSFVTMNTLADDAATSTDPDFSMDTRTVGGGWFAVPDPGNQRHAVDISGITGNPGEAGVLIAQITLVCPPGLDGDGTVAVPDLLALLAAWGPNPGHQADLDGDGVVAVPDLLILLAAWGPCSRGYSGTVRLYTSTFDGGSLEGAIASVSAQFE